MNQGNAQPTSAGQTAGLPRRILRKGTHSCAECKRRKIRCFFDRTSAGVCMPCQRRGSPCISQELVDVPLQTDVNIGERLKRVEEMLEKATEKLSVSDQALASQPGSLTTQSFPPTLGCSASVPPGFDMSASRSPAGMPTGTGEFVLPKYADTCRTLHAAFPSQNDSRILFDAGKAIITIQALCLPQRDVFNAKTVQLTAALSTHPPVTAHPIVLARTIIYHALCIQQADPGFDRQALQEADDLDLLMQRYYDLASGLVTCHDELLDSLEGLETLVCEAMYLVNLGNLRRALLVLRRASTLAQFMGFHQSERGQFKRTVRQLDPSTNISGEFVWNYIAYHERYISLLLGMPSSIMSTRFGTDKKFPGQTDYEWFVQFQVDIGDTIIKRNQERDFSMATTSEIDATMNELATSMPTSWWTPMHVPPGSVLPEIYYRMMSAQNQMIHYNMLTVLHLPYLLQNNIADQDFSHSKETCLYASREVLNRYISFRNIVRVVYCCRLVDFCAFSASMTLLLAYLSGAGQNSGHQRIGDRALIEKTLETLDELNHLNGDELTRETARLTRRLRDLEAAATTGNYTYSCRLEKAQRPSPTQRESGLYIDIPYFGCVKLACEAEGHGSGSENLPNISISTARAQFPLSGGPDLVYHMANYYQEDQSGMEFDMPMPDLMAGTEDWAFQGVDTAYFAGLVGGGEFNTGDWEAIWGDGTYPVTGENGRMFHTSGV
ncbi:hypothetical protein P154DRAFT_599987 [Amniculicola lignicola CBS 123094]|uniref:Zn(2)-C6 fungal-type domain-containing protein n=1 Tax=Amniculicola lignicola CBS 123094 TaxID=1392246 RepID=A0A6A5WFF2_9PLEO|nr:hypothetical protein P154DRAFT_599987 [Amniculicola lignicola CBS 123094]